MLNIYSFGFLLLVSLAVTVVGLRLSIPQRRPDFDEVSALDTLPNLPTTQELLPEYVESHRR